MGAAALQEDLEVLFAGRTGEQLLSPRRDRVIRSAAFHCHPANGFMKTAHSILPVVQYTWGFVNSCAPFYFYFYYQVPRPSTPPHTHTFISLSATDIFALRVEGGRLSRMVQQRGSVLVMCSDTSMCVWIHYTSSDQGEREIYTV